MIVVAFIINKCLIFLGLLSPKHIEHVLIVLVDGFDGIADELLPALALVAVGGAGLHGHDGVQHEDALLGPTGQVAVDRVRHFEGIDVDV